MQETEIAGELGTSKDCVATEKLCVLPQTSKYLGGMGGLCYWVSKYLMIYLLYFEIKQKLRYKAM